MGFNPNRFFFFISRMLLVLVYALAATSRAQAQPPPQFKCTTQLATCPALIEYASLDSTTLGSIATLFGVKNLRNILGANSFPPSTLANKTVAAKGIIRIPFKCRCNNNGTGVSDRRPTYKVQGGDDLYHIAAEVFSGLVTYPQIQAVNKIVNSSLIMPGQELWIPLPCSCDEVNQTKVVHYGHVVQPGSTVEKIAQDYNTSSVTLLSLNGIADAKDLKAGQVLDVPLKVCSSAIRNESLDFPLLVASATYIYTANNCVRCKCDSANNLTLQCEPSQLKPTNWLTCPSMQCEGSSNLSIGNSSTSSSPCNLTTCAYAGYTSQSILTTLTDQSTCPASEGSRIILRGRDWNYLFIAVHLIIIVYLFVF
ncbi:LysM domain-containing GPI-anchored protein like [Quillaja saponaria]|uniref:LysM domain-containing GPI-anchored protein like n=1 Tax=Quillaja saponaria TaxID=32244 RepID=A0AAD7LZJ2_QUISA|nr:LysM domain-containing GPI-anchored protein like [Quillaja saponaria]